MIVVIIYIDSVFIIECKNYPPITVNANGIISFQFSF